jgi:hypothetical protein
MRPRCVCVLRECLRRSLSPQCQEAVLDTVANSDSGIVHFGVLI